LILAIAVSIPVTLYLQYRHGTFQVGNNFVNISCTQFAFRAAVQEEHRLESQGQLETASEFAGFARLKHAHPRKELVIAFCIGFFAVLLTNWLRLKYPWWPIHPVLFLVLGTWHAGQMAGSILIGWFIKSTVTRFAGNRIYQKLKPMMLGLIAGEMLGAFIPIVIGWIYYFITGTPGQTFQVFTLF
ncbi:MAG: hypothetical protein D6820_02405, partial [Lentisphaerae bacterium]